MTQFINGGRGGIDNFVSHDLPTPPPPLERTVDGNWDETTANFTGVVLRHDQDEWGHPALFGDNERQPCPVVTNSSRPSPPQAWKSPM